LVATFESILRRSFSRLWCICVISSAIRWVWLVLLEWTASRCWITLHSTLFHMWFELKLCFCWIFRTSRSTSHIPLVLARFLRHEQQRRTYWISRLWGEYRILAKETWWRIVCCCSWVTLYGNRADRLPSNATPDRRPREDQSPTARHR
jgi:hypothetical protein